jgi:serine phosphatase RsbU (regulator of sigma subunit)
LWNEHRAELESPARFMETVNRRLQALVRDGGFFGTAVLACYDAASGELRIVRAGHPPPLLFRVEGKVEAMGQSNPALGLFPRTTYQEANAQLKARDMLLLYTDGATELFDSDERELGRAGLEQLVRTHAERGGIAAINLEELEEQLLRFTNQIHLPDDLTLVKLCRLR